MGTWDMRAIYRLDSILLSKRRRKKMSVLMPSVVRPSPWKGINPFRYTPIIPPESVVQHKLFAKGVPEAPAE